ncbi:hypothetical protein GGX14DRAFT_394617 [Mycena pura]|uniref:Uncharacterized protein n=1 Tax=Mycena pura TaxID=153505 RepID=A0AAD6VEI5_9AGAR|nr:hypothetical protein GGX14DRAFT_394617 [Mycena pura]
MSTNNAPTLAVPTPRRKWGTSLRQPSPKGNSTTPAHGQAPVDPTRIEWLEPLLVVARAGVAAGEACPIPYVKGAFSIVVLLLETIQKMGKNRDDLRDLCDNTVKVMDIIQRRISSHQGTADKLIELCKEFET